VEAEVTRLKDVADHAGVSTATISRVLSGKGYVSPPLRERVLAAVAELNYVPNGIARSMTQRRTRVLGLIVSDITNPFFTAVARAVEDTAQEAGYTLVLCNSDERLVKERAYLAVLRENRVDGIILAATTTETAHVEPLIGAGIQLVLIDRGVPDLSVPSVQVDNFGGMYEATNYLLALGHHRIALIAGGMAISTAQERQEGFEAALQDAGIDFTGAGEARIVDGGLSIQGGHDAALQLWDHPDRPTAIVAWSNVTTTGLLLALHERGVHVPDDVSIIGFDDLPQFVFLDHSITVVEQPTYEMGRQACQFLVRLLDEEVPVPAGDARVRLPARLVVRDSCRPLLASNPETAVAHA
jgi:DNA-binding LacI/PurR family transcriptional regulator